MPAEQSFAWQVLTAHAAEVTGHADGRHGHRSSCSSAAAAADPIASADRRDLARLTRRSRSAASTPAARSAAACGQPARQRGHPAYLAQVLGRPPPAASSGRCAATAARIARWSASTRTQNSRPSGSIMRAVDRRRAAAVVDQLQQRVAARGRDRDVEGVMGDEHRRPRSPSTGRTGRPGARPGRARCGASAASRVAGTSTIVRTSSSSATPTAPVACHRLTPVAQAVGELGRARVRHEAAAGHAADGHDEVLAGEQPQRLPDRAAADPGAAAELRLGGQPVARAQAPRGDLGTQGVGQSLVRGCAQIDAHGQ